MSGMQLLSYALNSTGGGGGGGGERGLFTYALISVEPRY